MTLGEKLVGVDFNVTGDKSVDLIKKKSAELINLLDEIRDEDGASSNKKRAASYAITQFEDGCMWAVKSIFR